MTRWLPVLVAALLGLGGLARWTLWQDEAFTWLLVQRDFAGVLDGAAQDRHPPLYYVLAKVCAYAGDRDFLLRLPAGLSFVLAVALATRLRWRAVPWLLALSPVALLYAHTARMYAVLLACATGQLVASLALAEGRRGWATYLGLGLATAVAIWTHYVGIACVFAAGLGCALVLARERAWRELGKLVATFALAGATFLPWALGPLQFQLAAKNVATERTWTVLSYLWWSFDTRVPLASFALAALQLGGLVALRRVPPGVRLVVGVNVATALLLPWIFSDSLPAQNPRNYLQFLPTGLVLVALAAAEARRFALPTIAGVLLLSAEPLWDLWTRPVSPQEPGTGFDYQVEADVLDASVPANGGLYFRPPYLVQQYQRYAPDLVARTKRPVDLHAWLALSRGEHIESAVSARYTAACTFRMGFRFVLYAEEGPGCEAVQRWVLEVARAERYAPFLQELARRALAAGDASLAATYASVGAERVRAHPALAITLAEASLRAGDHEGALAAADRALDIARRWRHGGYAVAEAWSLRAKALTELGRDPAAALAASECARRHVLPEVCGEPWAPLFAWLPAADLGPLVLPPLPALSESQKVPPPAGPPAGFERAALWGFEGPGLPEGWMDNAGSPVAPSAVVGAVEGGEGVRLTTGEERQVALTCGPAVAASARMSVRLRWTFDGGDARTAARLELRMADDAGNVRQVGGQPLLETPLQIATPTRWRVDRFDLRPAEGTARVRPCLKLEGRAAASFAVDWLEISGGGA